MSAQSRKWVPSERMRHVLIAMAIAIVVAATTLLRPLDITAWSLQSKIFDRQASGDIVFVGLEGDPGAGTSVVGNRRLAHTLAELDRAGASRIFIDLPLERSQSADADRELLLQLDKADARITLTSATENEGVDERSSYTSDLYFSDGQTIVSSDYEPDFLGYVWGFRAHSEREGDGAAGELKSLSFALADSDGSRSAVLPDYAILAASVPTLTYSDVVGQNEDLDGKTAVIGLSGPFAHQVKIPGSGTAPSTVVHILAAETLARGSGGTMHWLPALMLFGLLLAGCAAVTRSKMQRRLLYAGLVLVLVSAVFITAALGIRLVFSGMLSLLAAFAIQRAIANYKRRYLYVDERTRLPNFAALHRDLAESAETSVKAVMVAKIARLESVFATLSAHQQNKYVRQIANRLALGDENAVVYYSGGKYLAFVLEKAAYVDLESHLEGLRAITCQSITLSGQPLDVSVTIGADLAIGESASRRISAATAAADQAREAYRPVFVIDDVETEGDHWDHSLQAALESALSEDRISIKLQPQVDLQSGRIVGAEALARWNDEKKGEISPASFIGQCERVGRLDDLTKRVMGKTVRAAEALDDQGHRIRMSVNVSAVQFVDRRIAELVAKTLADHRIAPERLTIEITETARIEDFAVAKAVMEEIKSYGIAVAMDDFGIESANLQALLELPFDEVKIDQAFVKQMDQSVKARAIVTNAIAMIKDAGMTSVAEGIENQRIYDLLRDSGCNIGQGYFIARPMLMAEIQEILDLQRDTLSRSRKIG